ncbi:MAG: GspE family protein [Desulfovibrio sp.]|nr:GspE family protein [Desulfovibrio sp.]
MRENLKKVNLSGKTTFRHTHDGVRYRVARMINIDDQTVWFLRRQPGHAPPFFRQGLPRYLENWLMAPEQCQGLVLFSGAQSSGKTTMASAYIVERLKTYGGHAVTFENPAELPLNGNWGDHGHCYQSEIVDESELPRHIVQAHRLASPNIIFIGEIRTKYTALESLRVALGSSHQLVVATIHGVDVTKALNRLMLWARELDGLNAFLNLSSTLLAVVHLDLVDNNGKLVLSSPEHLLLPFSEHVLGVRAKLCEGQVQSLKEDMRSLKNRIASEGDGAI